MIDQAEPLAHSTLLGSLIRSLGNCPAGSTPSISDNPRGLSHPFNGAVYLGLGLEEEKEQKIAEEIVGRKQ